MLIYVYRGGNLTQTDKKKCVTKKLPPSDERHEDNMHI